MRPLLICKEILIPGLIAGLTITFLGVFLKIMHWNIGFVSPDLLLIMGTLFSVVIWITVLLDLIRNKVNNKFIWLIGMITFGNIISLLYLLKRK